MTLSALIASVDDWQSKTPAQLLAILNTESVQYADHRLWTWAGIALVAGNSSAEALRIALTENGMGWAVHQLGGLGIDLSLPDVQANLYALDALGVPGMATVATTVKRMISPIESAGLSNVTLADVESAQLSLFKADWSARFATILNQLGTAEHADGLAALDVLATEIATQ